MPNQASSAVWRFILLLASACYLPIELVVNSSLVSVAGSSDLTRESLESLELFGRTVSACGFSLLLIGLLTRSESLVRNIINATLITIFAWPAAFIGQKELIDAYIITPSTAEQRQQAYGSRMVRTAIESGALEIEGVDYDTAREDDPAQMTFMTVFGGLVYVDPLLLESIKSHAPTLVEQHARRQVDGQFDTAYAAYSTARDEMRGRYDQYQEIMTTYRQKQKSIPAEVEKQARKAEVKIEEGRQSYLEKSLDYEKRATAGAKKLAPWMYKYFHYQNSKVCGKRCKARLRENYEKRMRENGLAGTPPSYWLVREEVTTKDNVKDMAFEAVGTLGISLVFAGLDKMLGGDGGWEDERYFYTKDERHYHYKLVNHEKNLARFEKKVGIPYGLKARDAFMDHPAAGRVLRAQFAKSDIRLPKGWLPYETERVKLAINQMLDRKLKSELERNIAKSGAKIPIGLSWRGFQRHDSVQSAFKGVLGELYREPVLLTWNNKQFEDKIIEPSIQAETKRLLAALEANQKEFADGGELESDGKHALRSVVVPPIAMAISLFLSIATAIRLILGFFAPLLKRVRGLSHGLFGIALIAVIGLPLAVDAIAESDDRSANEYFVKTLEKHSHVITAVALKWTLAVQPIVYPLGEAVNEAMQIYSPEGE